MWNISKFDNVLCAHQGFLDDEESAHIQQLKTLCPDQPRGTIIQLLHYFEMEEVEQDSVIWKQGDVSNSAILLVDGHLRSIVEEEAGTTEEVQVGTLLGELCLLTGERRKSSIITTRRSVIYILTKDKLDEMLEQEPNLAFLFQGIALRYMSYRLQYVGNRIWETKCLPI